MYGYLYFFGFLMQVLKVCVKNCCNYIINNKIQIVVVNINRKNTCSYKL